MKISSSCADYCSVHLDFSPYPPAKEDDPGDSAFEKSIASIYVVAGRAKVDPSSM
ncbi:hypothetical protein [Bradyrhizobium sp. McL0616]|uniref:hypothetical protein n=1 Tax=Bradyrhizobium sp. McL0616 TaxID=3415674 RepID=UPI003CE6D6D6